MSTTKSRAPLVRSSDVPDAVIAVIGPRDKVTRSLRAALGKRFVVAHYSTPAKLLRSVREQARRVEPPQQHVVVFNFAIQAKAAAGHRNRVRQERASRSLSSGTAQQALFLKWLKAIRELDRCAPEQPIVVAADEHRQAGLIQDALKAGADDWFTVDVAEHPALLAHRFEQILARFHQRCEQRFFKSLKGIDLGEGSPDSVAQRSSARPTPARTSLPSDQGAHVKSGAVPHEAPITPERRYAERRMAERRKVEFIDAPAAPGFVDGEHWEAPSNDETEAAAVARVREAAQQPSPTERMERFAEMLEVPTPDLRASSGRLDAKQVAAALGLSLRQLATALPISSQALSETPDSPKAQPVLHALARVLAALRVILPNEADQRAWLQTPNSRWQNRSPRDAILAGEEEAVARALEMIRDGGVGG